MRDIDSDGGGGITNANNIVIIIDGLGERCASSQKAERRKIDMMLIRQFQFSVAQT